MLEQLKQHEEDLINKSDEILHLRLKFEVEKRDYVTKIIQLQEENAYLKVDLICFFIPVFNLGLLILVS